MSIRLSATPEDLRKGVLELKTRQDIASLLDVKYELLNYHLYISPADKRYTSFTLPKKSGGERRISAPVTGLKIIQQKLNQALQAVYQPKPATQGFSPERSIVTNAYPHTGKKYVLNIDLQDFFPSINFGRVRGMFMATPYNLPEEV